MSLPSKISIFEKKYSWIKRNYRYSIGDLVSSHFFLLGGLPAFTMTSPHPFIKRLSAFIREKSLLKRGDKVVLAVSGGVDSTVMLEAFRELRRTWDIGLSVAHVNHQLRGEESDGDERFVRETARRCRIPFYSTRVDVLGRAHAMKLSKQEAARELRYAYIEEIRCQTLSDRVATAHQADDNAETVLLNVLRGTGVRGLAGIPCKREDGRIIRPLLFARRDDILQFARDRNVKYRNDSSNDSDFYARNHLRHHVIPALERELGPEVCVTLNRLSDTAREFADFLDRLVDERLNRTVSFGTEGCSVLIPSLEQEPAFLRGEIILRILRHLRIEPSQAKVNDILAICRRQTGRLLKMPGGMVVRKNRKVLEFKTEKPDEVLHQQVTVGEMYQGPGFVLSVGLPGPVPPVLPHGGATEYIDAEKLDRSLVLRSWKTGDWFVPLGMNRKKKLSDFFGDEKIPGYEKTKIPILESRDRIVWVCGKRLDDRFKITAGTRRAVKLTSSTTLSPST